MTLADLRVGESGVITNSASVPERLIEMGFTSGAKITMLRKAPFGSPIEFYILGCGVCIRSDAARKIEIERIDCDD